MKHHTHQVWTDCFCCVIRPCGKNDINAGNREFGGKNIHCSHCPRSRLVRRSVTCERGYMNWQKWVLVVTYLLSTLLTIGTVGKKREAITPGVAVAATIANLLLIALVVTA